MKSLLILSFVAIACAVQYRGLSEIQAFQQTAAFTSNYPDALIAPTLASLTYPTTYSSLTNDVFTLDGAGTSVGNNTVTGGTITFTGGGDTVVLGFVAAYTNVSTPSVFTITGVGYPKFLASTNYIGSVQLATSTQQAYTVTPTLALVAVAATAYVPPTITTFNMPSPQTGGCDAVDCINPPTGNATATPVLASASLVTVLRPPTATTGVRFTFVTNFGGSEADFTSDSQEILMSVGGFSNGRYVPVITNTATTLVPQNQALTISAAVRDGASQFNRWTYYPESSFNTLQSTVTLSSGTADIVAPTCTVAAVVPNTLPTNLTASSIVVSALCTDDVGLWTAGVIYQINVNGAQPSYGVVNIPTLASTITIPAFVSGSVVIQGVFAVDNSGNTVLYGGCGGLTGLDTVCGGTSSASTASLSVLTLAVFAIFALFA